MALFAVSRYLGDEHVKEQSSKADAILKKLQADAEARRKQRGIRTGKVLRDNSKKKLVSEKFKDKNDRTPTSGEIKIGKKSTLKDCEETADGDIEVTPKKRRKRKSDKEGKTSEESENNFERTTSQDRETTSSDHNKHDPNADTTGKKIEIQRQNKKCDRQ